MNLNIYKYWTIPFNTCGSVMVLCFYLFGLKQIQSLFFKSGILSNLLSLLDRCKHSYPQKVIFSFFILFAVGKLNAATYTTIADGNWNSGATWAGGTAPGSTINAADVVNINHVVTYNVGNDLEVRGTVNIFNGTFRTALTGNGSGKSVFIRSGGKWNMCNGAMYLPIFSCGYGCYTGSSLSGNFLNEGGTIVVYNSTVEIAQNLEDASSPAGAGSRTFVGGCIKIGENFLNKGAIDLYDSFCLELGYHGSGNWKNEHRQTFQNSCTIKLLGSGSIDNVASSPNGILGGAGSPDIVALGVANGNVSNNGPWSAQVLDFCIGGGSVGGSQSTDFTNDVTNNDTGAACTAVNAADCDVCPTATCNLGVTASIVSQIPCDGSGGGSVTANITAGSGTLSCGGSTTVTYAWSNSQTTQTITGLPAGTYKVTVTDASGCTAEASITLEESACCTLDYTCPPADGGTFTCNTVPSPNTDLITILDSCGIVNITVNVDTSGCVNDTIFITHTYIIDDGSDEDTCVQVFTLIDNTPPVLAGVPGNQTVDCNAIPAPPTDTATDKCDTAVPVSYSQISDTVVDGCGVIVREWTATDACGNVVTGTQTITVVDTTPPVLAGVPGNQTVDCNAIPAPPTVTATDNCDTAVPVSYSETSNTVVDGCGQIVREWTATDACGNIVTETQTITVTDTEAPVLVGVRSEQTVDCNAIPAPATVTATDNCDTDVPVSYTETSNTVVDGCGQIVREWTATDACGNIVTETQTITVTDTEAPVLVGVPADQTVDCNAIPAPATVTATDNCDTNVPVTYTETSNTVVDGCGQIVREWTATDACGNNITETQTITVTDTEPPTLIGVPADQNRKSDAKRARATVRATDICDQ